ncbi:tetratricopeptide repeat protein [Actinomadura sp. 9N215]|uniref:tetratricopeptide repeat protein n=1 Tax=Actinomadura sp. 9N215 TaxID=3375150 RepID=UPI0037926461
MATAGEAEALNELGKVLTETTGPHAAAAVFEQAFTLARRVQSPLDEAHALDGLAHCADHIGDRPTAVARMREAVALYQRLGSTETDQAAAYLAALENSAPADE